MTSRTDDLSGSQNENLLSDCLYESDFYQVKNWVIDSGNQKKLTRDYNDCFCFVLIKKGNFFFDLSRKTYEMHTGHVAIDKPNYEYCLRPSSGECSIFNFTEDFYSRFKDDLNLQNSSFFSNVNTLTQVLKSIPATEYLHHQILKMIHEGGKLAVDQLVMELLKNIVSPITNSSLDNEFDASLKKYHLVTIDRAKEYMQENFASDISLYEISIYSHVSPFHFSRIFKRFTGYSPYQYLLNIRLKHAEMLLKCSTMSISDVSFYSGFNSIEHFATSFKQKYKLNPTRYRNLHQL